MAAIFFSISFFTLDSSPWVSLTTASFAFFEIMSSRTFVSAFSSTSLSFLSCSLALLASTLLLLSISVTSLVFYVSCFLEISSNFFFSSSSYFFLIRCSRCFLFSYNLSSAASTFLAASTRLPASAVASAVDPVAGV